MEPTALNGDGLDIRGLLARAQAEHPSEAKELYPIAHHAYGDKRARYAPYCGRCGYWWSERGTTSADLAQALTENHPRHMVYEDMAREQIVTTTVNQIVDRMLDVMDAEATIDRADHDPTERR